MIRITGNKEIDEAEHRTPWGRSQTRTPQPYRSLVMMKVLIPILVMIGMVGCAQRTELTNGVIMATAKGQYLPWSVNGRATEGWDPSPSVTFEIRSVLGQRRLLLLMA